MMGIWSCQIWLEVVDMVDIASLLDMDMADNKMAENQILIMI